MASAQRLTATLHRHSSHWHIAPGLCSAPSTYVLFCPALVTIPQLRVVSTVSLLPPSRSAPFCASPPPGLNCTACNFRSSTWLAKRTSGPMPPVAGASASCSIAPPNACALHLLSLRPHRIRFHSEARRIPSRHASARHSAAFCVNSSM